MKSILLVVIVFFPSLHQIEREQPDLVVVKFTWGKEKQNTRMIRGDAKGSGGVTSTPMTNNRDLRSRGTDLRTVEKTAAKSAEKPVSNYELRLELKNTGTTAVRSLIWEFRPTAGPADYQPKQYLCALQVKPKEKKVLEVFTPYAPVKVITAEERSDGLKDGEVVINQIEYVDGSVWKKRGWNYRLPADSLSKLSEGQCSVF
jgi:hypothetical protein